ncbi:ABC transporter permease [Actinoplanes sp. NPDC049316]|uniref:ABC transporter permease n=1 Tax=Actinoplanes sp. NPDC049316 TaxID=3154727 RepID=UPI00343B3320
MDSDRALRPRPALTLSRHAVRAFFRNPMAAFFTLIFPLVFLVIVASLVGDERTPEGVRVVQYLVAPFAVFGVAQAAFSVLAIDTAILRENGVLLRLRGAPVPRRAVLASRVVASLVASFTSFLLVGAVGVLVFGVTLQWRKMPALLVTLLLGVACLAALGMALTSVTRTVLAAQTAAQGLLIPLAFISDVFIVGADLPRWLSAIGTALPLKHFADAAAATFDPDPGYGWSPGHLAMLAGWTVAGAAVAMWRFGWSPRGSAGGRTARPAGAAGTPARVVPQPSTATRTGRPTAVALLLGQTRFALLGMRRDALATFFTLVFPALILVLFPVVFGSARVHGLTMAQYLLPGMIAYAAALAGYVNLPESVAAARADGVLKRLGGTPLPVRWYLGGRVLCALLVGLISAVLLGVVAVAGLGVRLDPVRLPAVVLAVVLGGICFCALGLALAAVLPRLRSLTAITLGTLLPLCFVSEIFVVGDAPLPGWLRTIGEVFPLRHLMESLLAATRPDAGGAGFAWSDLAVVTAWAAAGILVTAWRRGAFAGAEHAATPMRTGRTGVAAHR